MIALQELSPKELSQIRYACAYLFSPDLAKNNQFIQNLRLESLRKAFRKKAKQYHPDLNNSDAPEMLTRRQERFIKINDSYNVVKNYLSQEEYAQAGTVIRDKPKIIAVGGAKGGIGKSMFVSNLGILLSSLGKSTTLIDLDLGGANLHLYLGETSIRKTINDFLNKKARSLSDITILSRYGPSLIGGDGSELGAGNINYLRKLKLLKTIKQIDTEYVIMDLGGGTSYNTLDFFLAADCQIVITTCEPAAYLEAYSFVKVALYRKLNRIFGSESKWNKQKDTELTAIIREATHTGSSNEITSIHELIKIIKDSRPKHLHLIHQILKSFNPYLIVNMVNADSNYKDVVTRIQDVSQKMLSIEVKHLGNFSFEHEVKNATNQLRPVLAKYPRGNFAKQMNGMITKLWPNGI